MAMASIEITQGTTSNMFWILFRLNRRSKHPLASASIDEKRGLFGRIKRYWWSLVRCYQKEGSEHRATHVHQAELVVKQGRIYLTIWRLNINLKSTWSLYFKKIESNLYLLKLNLRCLIIVVIAPSTVRLLLWIILIYLKNVKYPLL